MHECIKQTGQNVQGKKAVERKMSSKGVKNVWKKLLLDWN